MAAAFPIHVDPVMEPQAPSSIEQAILRRIEELCVGVEQTTEHVKIYTTPALKSVLKLAKK